LKHWKVDESGFLQRIINGYFQHAQAVVNAPLEINRGGLLKIFSGTRHLGDVESGEKNLGEHLIVKHEIVGIFLEIDRQQNIP
jgi:hypothetical protein